MRYFLADHPRAEHGIDLPGEPLLLWGFIPALETDA